jgi:eukaryotic-like serine/threonine-protein kinase
MDFGIARQRSADFKTSTGIVMGTPRFMSPEQIAGSPVDHRSDIFSLGTVLYEMLTLSPLFAGEDTPQIAHNVATVEHMPPSRVNAEATSMLDFVVAKALKKDPELRYQDCYDFASDLRTCLVELRVRQSAPGAERNGGKEKTSRTKTVKLDSTGADKAPLAPAAVAIVSDTRLPLSPQFDSGGAVQRLERPSRRDYRVLSRAPRPVGVLRRFTSDAAPRMLFVTLAVAAAVSAYVAF